MKPDMVVQLGKLLRREFSEMSKLPESDAWELIAERAVQEVERANLKIGAILEVLGTAQRSRTLDLIGEWCRVYGKDLCPPPGSHDSFGDGVRWAKSQVMGIITGGRKT